jgi:formylglycine-generating enzyme required for sulfatase activity
MIDQLIAALSKEVGLTSKEIADVIWLALQIQGSDQSVPVDDFVTDVENAQSNAKPRSPDNALPTRPQEFSNQQESPTPQAGLHSPEAQQNQGGFGEALTLRVPDARSLREPLPLARSLKPLLRRVTTGGSATLDEAATVERIADEGIWMPVLKPGLEPWLDLALVVDESVSMQIWRRTVAELQRLVEHYGVFRDVRIWGLATDRQGQVRLRPGLGGSAGRQAVHRPSELVDPSGRRLILVATDCVASLWKNGAMLPVLKLWAASGPMAIVQMLPEWLWARTGLGFASTVRLRSLLPGVPNQQLGVQAGATWDEVDLELGIKVPVVTLEPEPFGAWTQMVAGKGGAWSLGVVFESEWVSGLGGRPTSSSDLDGEQRVQRFRVTASPMARRLAGLLAAAPVISLPIVRIIQDRLLPMSKQVHVAEVFLGGLLKPLVEIEVGMNPDAVQYEFFDGARDLLVDSVATSDAVSVLDAVSNFVAERLGLSLDAFMAVLQNPVQAEDQGLVGQSRPFAIVTAQVLRKLGGEYAAFAEELERSSQVNASTELTYFGDSVDQDTASSLEAIEITEVAYRSLLWEQGGTKIYASPTDSPWAALPFNALVVPVSATGGLGSFGRAFEEFFNESALGNDFLRQLIDDTMRELNQTLITPQHPLLIQVGNVIPELVYFERLPNEQSPSPPDFSLTDDPDIRRFIICVTVDSKQGVSIRNAAIVMESILRLAEEQRLERVILPLVGAGDYGLPVNEVTTAMLDVIRSKKISRIREITFVSRDTSSIKAINRFFQQISTIKSLSRTDGKDEADYQEQLEQAVAICQRTLQVYTREAFPQEWAMTQNYLANAYRDRIRGERADNLEQAIAAYQLALQVYTHEAFPQDWAATQNNLAIAYCNRIQGDRADNLEQAIEASLLALQVYTSEAFPQNWATTQNNLANAYRERIRGERADNIEQAIAAFQLALQVYTREMFPYQWAATQNSLATAYSNRIRGDRADNLEQAIVASQLALQVYTSEAFPYQWAAIQNNLAQLTMTASKERGDVQQLSQLESRSVKKTIEVFFSYSREDKPLRDKLEVHLSSLERQGVISSWHDRQIVAGSEWEEEIDRHMRSADIILLLISPNFLNSQYCYEIELPQAIARHDAGEAYVLPILLRPVAGWEELPFAKLQVYPSGGKPITKWEDQDSAFVDVVEGIEIATEQLLKHRKAQEVPQQERLKAEFLAKEVRALELNRSEQKQIIKLQQEQEQEQARQDRQSLTIYVTKRKFLGSGERIPLLDMVAIPGGKFWMGVADGEGQGNEKPRREVTISPFYISKYPITQKQYQTVLGKRPSHFRGENRPVENVTWWDAVSFCEALSKKSDRQFTLPSEAQWEYACRAGTTTLFHFGETISMNQANYNGNFDDFIGEGIYREQTTDVGIFSPNDFGLYDMHGNVWEWCADHWHDNYEGALNDGSPWLTNNSSTSRSVRGGSWLRGSDRCRSASRFRFSPNAKDNSIGFRVICI